MSRRQNSVTRVKSSSSISSGKDSTESSIVVRKMSDEETEMFVRSFIELKLSRNILEPSLFPKCLQLLTNADMKVRSDALRIVACQLQTGNPALRPYCGELCKLLTKSNVMLPKNGYADDENDNDLFVSTVNYQRDLCSVVLCLQSYFPDLLTKHIKKVCDYFVRWTGSERIERALAGSEYWAKFKVDATGAPAFFQAWANAVATRLGALVPNLLRTMIYRAKHVAFLEEFGSTTVENAHQFPMTPDIERFSNVRNFAALGFERVSQMFESEVIAVYRPYLERWIQSDDWLEVEASILSLSAFTEGASMPRAMQEVYPVIVPLLLDYFSHPKPLVRSIAVFAMPHFFHYPIKGIKDPAGRVLRHTWMLLEDDCIEVRSLAIRSLRAMLSYLAYDLTPYVPKIVEALIRADPFMIGESRAVYFECIGCLFSRLFSRDSSSLAADDVDRLVQPIMRQWDRLDCRFGRPSLYVGVGNVNDNNDINVNDNNVNDNNVNDSNVNDVGVVGLCQTLCVVVTYCPAIIFAAYARQIFSRASEHLEKIAPPSSSDAEGCGDAPGTVSELAEVAAMSEHMVSYLDLLSAIFDGQESEAFSLAVEHGLARLLHKILYDGSLHHRVHQSALALVGHLAQFGTGPTDPPLDSFIDAIAAKLKNRENDGSKETPGGISENATYEVTNNALWTLAFIAKDGAPAGREKLFGLVDDLVRIFKNTGGHPGCIINAALSLTNVCAAWPNQTVGVIVKEDVFLHLCCLLQSEFPRDDEKVAIFKNVCAVVSRIVERIPNEFWAQFLVAAAVVKHSDDELRKSLQSLVNEIRSTVENVVWSRLTQEIGPNVACILRKRYKLY